MPQQPMPDDTMLTFRFSLGEYKNHVRPRRWKGPDIGRVFTRETQCDHFNDTGRVLDQLPSLARQGANIGTLSAQSTFVGAVFRAEKVADPRKTRRRQQVSAIATLEERENKYRHGGVVRVVGQTRAHPPHHPVSMMFLCLPDSPPKTGSLNVHVLLDGKSPFSVSLTW